MRIRGTASRGRAYLFFLCTLQWWSVPNGLPAHDGVAHHGPTYEVTSAAVLQSDQPRLILSITDAATGQPTAARFSLRIDGRDYVPEALGSHGLRFVSVHQGKKQRFVVLYARGSGRVEIPLPEDGQQITVAVAKGFEYLPTQVSVTRGDSVTQVDVPLRRWANMAAEGWKAADAHLHYERLDPNNDPDWLTMLAADDLSHGHFMVLKGGNLPGVWAQQFAYGPAGEAGDGQRLIRPGEEYRDGYQGHINLLGVREVIQPISTGGIGGREMPYHYPPLVDVLQQARKLDGIVGPAHGGTLSRSPTAALDTVLGAVDFFEIANTHLYELDVWYRMMNCGFVVPPAAGTDLPNFPYRDPWQPFLGEIRMYVRSRGRHDFDSWKQALRRGEVFVTSGPMIGLAVNDVGPGGTLHLPAGGGDVRVQAELTSPQLLQSLELIRNGQPEAMEPVRDRDNAIHRWTISTSLRIEHSCWIAARGSGQLKQSLAAQTGIEKHALAHTAAVQVLVDEQPIAVRDELELLRRQLLRQKEFYRSEGNFEQAEHRERVLQLFQTALQSVEQRMK